MIDVIVLMCCFQHVSSEWGNMTRPTREWSLCVFYIRQYGLWMGRCWKYSHTTSV